LKVGASLALMAAALASATAPERIRGARWCCVCRLVVRLRYPLVLREPIAGRGQERIDALIEELQLHGWTGDKDKARLILEAMADKDPSLIE
jgi:hypothetical protein